MLDTNAIGQSIRQFRKKNGLSQTELAEKIGKSLRTVQKYEKGEIEVSLSTISDIAGALNVSTAEILNYLLGHSDIRAQNLKLKSIRDKVGLSGKAVLMLARLKKEKSLRLRIINLLLEQADDDIEDDYDFDGIYEGSILNAICRYLDGTADKLLNEEFDVYSADPRRYDRIRSAVRKLIFDQAAEAIKSFDNLELCHK